MFVRKAINASILHKTFVYCKAINHKSFKKVTKHRKIFVITSLIWIITQIKENKNGKYMDY